MDFLTDMFINIRIRDVVDVVIVALVLYKLFTMIRETRAEQLLKGIVVLLLLTKTTEWMELYTINWMLSNAMTFGTLAILIVFQPELRRGLEYIGRSKIFSKSFMEIRSESMSKVTREISTAVASLARQKIGALIVIERQTGLNEIVETGTRIGGDVSSELLINTFIPNTPLHDGAVIIKEDKIKAAACFLPLTDELSVSKELGTRHRAALGISEKSDSLSIIVSEETGSISIAQDGKLSRHIDIKTLETLLGELYQQKTIDQAIMKIWRYRHEDDKK